ncbi:aldo/keto reductase [Kribbella sp. NPDC059898]|uniref:aldo/keto reductase n=1 Tax=Kribbella sp. NPDC059898 TaxID=3346995 RepID=UPI003666F8C6
MSTWRLGDVTVNRLGFGTMRLTANPDRSVAIAVLRRAVELGVDHLDTAAFYASGPRYANELIREALAPYPEGLTITTKVGPGTDPERGFYNATTARELRAQVETNLRQLGVDSLDVVNLRITGDGSLAERFGWLAELRSEGLIRQLGVSNVRLDHVEEALAVAPVVCVQNSYAVDRRGAEDAIIRYCADRGIAYVPFGSITGAVESPTVAAIAAAHGVTPAQIRLAWTLHHSPNILAIPGTGTVPHLEENLAAADIHLTPDDLAALG